jgi:betaine-homocysteine S-methyltransferase
LFEFERRGFVRAGCFVPEVVLEKPEQLKALHEEFVHSGSDVVEAYTVGNLQLFGLHRLNIFES